MAFKDLSMTDKRLVVKGVSVLLLKWIALTTLIGTASVFINEPLAYFAGGYLSASYLSYLQGELRED